MSKRFLRFLLLSLVLVCPGCRGCYQATIHDSITSVPGRVEISKLLVVLETYETWQTDAREEFKSSIIKDLSGNGFKLSVFVVDQLALNHAGELDNVLADDSYSHILFISQTNEIRKLGESRQLKKDTFDVSLLDARTSKKLWEMNLDVGHKFAGSKHSYIGRNMAYYVRSELIKSGILGGA